MQHLYHLGQYTLGAHLLVFCFCFHGSYQPGSTLDALRDFWKLKQLCHVIPSCEQKNVSFLPFAFTFFLFKKFPSNDFLGDIEYFNGHAGRRHTYLTSVISIYSQILFPRLGKLTAVPVWHLKKSSVLRVAKKRTFLIILKHFQFFFPISGP